MAFNVICTLGFVAAVGLVTVVVLPALIISGRISEMERRLEQRADEQQP